MTLPCLNHFTNVLLFINHICVKRTSKVNVDSESPFTSSWLCIDSQSDKPSAFMHDEQNLTWIEQTATLSRLVLDDVAEEDTGKYIVRISNKAGTVEKSCQVKVIKQKVKPQFVSCPTEVECREGEECTFKVTADNTNEAVLITDKSVTATRSGDHFIVSFTPNKSLKSGLLVIKGAGGEEQRQISFIVGAAFISPRFTSTPDDARVNVGENVRLACAFEGNPAPTLEWRLNGKKLRASGTELIIRNATEDDAGQYEMIVSNKLGTDSAAAFVEVMPKQKAPEFIAPLLKSQYNAIVGDNLELVFGTKAEPQGRYNISFNEIEIASGKTSSTVTYTLKVRL